MLDTIQDTLSDLKALFNNAPDLSIAIRKYLDENAGLKKQVEDFMKEKEAGSEGKTTEKCTRNPRYQSNQVLLSTTGRSSEEYRFPTSG